jgi:hypothetical protein
MAATPPNTPERPKRSEAEIVSRAGIPVMVGGLEKRIPVLPIGPTRRWREQLATTAAGRFGDLRNLADLSATAAAAGGVTDTLLELVLEYDREATLGGREWLEEHATDEELYEAFKAVAGQAYPFTRDLPRAAAWVEVLRDAAATAAASAASTNSPSASGASAPPGSTPS